MEGYNNMVHSQFVEKIDMLSKKKGLSQNKISEMLGISSAVLSQYKNGSYPGDIKSLEKKIVDFLDNQEKKDESLKIDYQEIAVTNPIFTAIDNARIHKDFSVVVGNAGTGKTATIFEYKKRKSFCVYVKLNNSNRGALLRALARELDIETKGGNNLIYDRIIYKLQNKEYVIIVDEADYLKENCLQLLRNISDDADVGVALFGLKRLQDNIVSQKEDYRQLESRIGTLLNLFDVGKYSIHDAEKIVKSVFKEASNELIKNLYDNSRGCIRTLTKLMQRSYENAMLKNREVNTDDVKVAALVVFRSAEKTFSYFD